jgi:hypothetical protein
MIGEGKAAKVVSSINSVLHIVREGTLQKHVLIFNKADSNSLVIRKEMQVFFCDRRLQEPRL